MNELMERDPLSLSDQDLDQIVACLREKRAQFDLGDKAAGNKKAAEKEKVKNISLTDLGL